MARITTGRPWSSAGNAGTAGTLHRIALEERSSGAWAMKSRQARSTAAPCSRGYSGAHRKISGPTGWQANSNEVTTPKFPPPPRRAQNRSATGA